MVPGKQMELLGEVIPLHKKLADRGQVELSTTPFYHPILPLLWDKRLARQAMPEVRCRGISKAIPKMPWIRFAGPWNSTSACSARNRAACGRRKARWPSRSPARSPPPAWNGSPPTKKFFRTRRSAGSLATAKVSCAIRRCSTGPGASKSKGRSIQIIFRDHAMSDQIGFHYQGTSAEHAVNDFLGKLEAIGRATTANAGQRPTLVSIILDGENCWEYYPNERRRFLAHASTAAWSSIREITPTRVCDYLDHYPATDKLGPLFAGSWIQHNFGIWIGHPECNRAWDLVYQTRSICNRPRPAARKRADQLAQARRELAIAEGSDWFWWFGDSHHSAQQDLFDRLFRKHLQNVYTLLGDSPPTELSQSIRMAPAAPGSIPTRPGCWM